MPYGTSGTAASPSSVLFSVVRSVRGSVACGPAYGLPTNLPWGLESAPSNSAFPAGLPDDTLFHPTFLYEVIWNTLGAIALVWIGRRASMQWGRLLAVYLIWYGAGRIVWESIRVDPSQVYFGLRVNVWAAIAAVVLGIVILIVQSRHTGLEPSPYTAKHLRNVADISSEDDFVDVSEPAGVDETVEPSPQHAS